MSYVPPLWVEDALSPSVKRRSMTFLAVLAVHLCLIILLALTRTIDQQPKKQGSLAVFALSAAANIAPPVPVTVPILPAKARPLDSNNAELVAEQQGAEGDPDGKICSPVDVVTARLANDPIVPAALDRVPRENRSISEAIVMWNAEWSQTTTTEDAPLANVRRLVHRALLDLPPDCLAMPVVGPRLIPVTRLDGSTSFLAFGSGEWSWQQLVETPETETAVEKRWAWEDLFGG